MNKILNSYWGKNYKLKPLLEKKKKAIWTVTVKYLNENRMAVNNWKMSMKKGKNGMLSDKENSIKRHTSFQVTWLKGKLQWQKIIFRQI